MVTTSGEPFAAAELAAVRRTRRLPRRTQFDYLHIRRLVDDLAATLGSFDGAVADVLDVYCGSRAYDDLYPSGATIVGLDIPGNPYGVADVVTDEFLPFEDESFDLVTCIEAFHYVEQPPHALEELRRVLRPGGTLLISVPFVWGYDRTVLEHRFTGPDLKALLGGWDDVRVVENGGRVVVWATLTGSLLESVRIRLPRPLGGLFRALYLALNGGASLLDRIERRGAQSQIALPMNLLVTARRPADS